MYYLNLLKPRFGILRDLIKASIHLEQSPNTKLKKTLFDRFLKLQLPECKVFVNYVWIDGCGVQMRSKMRILDSVPYSHKECPNWTFNGSSTGQAHAQCSDLLLLPVALYKDPMMGGNNKIVLCECYDKDNKPMSTNHRHQCESKMCEVKDKEPMIGMKQEFFLMDADGHPFGWGKAGGHPPLVNTYYCGVGAENVFGRELIEAFLRCALFSGVDMYGYNSEREPSHWEFFTGPTVGIKACDDLWMARFILCRMAEEYGAAISFHPQLMSQWSGSACSVFFSTKEMRCDDGLKAIETALGHLEKKHIDDMKVYAPNEGKDNVSRFAKFGRTISDKFNHGVADRTASVRIPLCVKEKKKGYFEDRRPAANCDPYLVVDALLRSTCT